MSEFGYNKPPSSVPFEGVRREGGVGKKECHNISLFTLLVWPETRFLGYIRSTLEVHFFDFILGVIKGKNFFL